MRIVVAGGAGFVGATLCRSLAARGEDVHAIVRPTTDVYRLADSGAVVHRSDLIDSDVVEKLMGGLNPSVVIHAASSDWRPGKGDDALGAWYGNTLTVVSLLTAMRGVKPDLMVVIGSSLEYADSEGPIKETHPERPSTGRGASKLAATIAALQWGEETRTATAVLRISSVYGPGQREDRVIPSLIRSLRTGSTFRVATHPNVRDFIYSSDVASAVSAVVEASLSGQEVFNIGTGVETSIPDLVRVAERVSGLRTRVSDSPFPPGPADRTHAAMDWKKAHDILGWTPEVSLEDGIGELWRMG